MGQELKLSQTLVSSAHLGANYSGSRNPYFILKNISVLNPTIPTMTIINIWSEDDDNQTYWFQISHLNYLNCNRSCWGRPHRTQVQWWQRWAPDNSNDDNDDDGDDVGGDDDDDDDLTAKNRRRAMLTKGPMAFAIELITTWRPKKNRN